MSIRLRLALWYTSVMWAALLVFGLLLYLAMSEQLNREVDDSIAAQADHVARAIRISATSATIPASIILPPVDEFASPGTYVQVLDDTAKVVARSENLGTRQLPSNPDPLTVEKKGQEGYFYYTATVGKDRVRVFDLPVLFHNVVIGHVQVGRSLSQIDSAVSQLKLFVVLAGAGALILAGGIGYLVARRALRPIDDITELARQIALSQSFSERLTETNARDEVGRLASTFNEMLSSLESAYSVQRRFVSDASHELRSPLTSIRGNIDVLRKVADMPKEDREEALSDMAAEAQRMSTLVTDLLALARADAGQQIELERVELDAVVRDAFRQMERQARGVQLVLGDVEQADVLGDPSRLKQLLLILLDNAIKYTPDSGRVEVSLLSNENFAELSVLDSGIGITEQDLPHIFERFFRADRARMRDEGGTGLGLAIADWIVSEHDGYIEVESSHGQGTEFVVHLPLVTPSRDID